jgi:hypothetical protein
VGRIEHRVDGSYQKVPDPTEITLIKGLAAETKNRISQDRHLLGLIVALTIEVQSLQARVRDLEVS